MSLLPGIYERELRRRKPLVNDYPRLPGSDVVLDLQIRSPLDPAWRIHPGTVIVRRVGSRRFVAANDPSGERNQPASVVALEVAHAGWAGTTVTVSQAPGLGVAVLLDPADDDNAKVIDRLNQHPGFSAHYLADEDHTGRIRIRTRAAGAGQHLHVLSSLPAAFGQDGAAGIGRDADYRVTIHRIVEVLSIDGKPLDVMVPTLLVGHFDVSELIHLTPEARLVLARRGSRFKES